MATNSFEAYVRHQPQVAIVDLKGEINSQAEQVLQRAYDQAIDQHPALLLLNFNQVEYINSSGLALIVGLLKRVQKVGCPLVACGLSEHYTEIFHITRLTDYISLFPDEASALQQIQIS